jgi:DNA polymerase III alpha subunit (gram-positive type)
MFPNLLIRSSKRHFIQIVENKETTQNAIKNARKDKFTNRIEEAVGLRKVLDLIIKNHKILVGHNVFQDLGFIWSQFIGKLPDTVERFSQDVLRCFPTYEPS